MGIPFTYADLSARLAEARSWATLVTEGNRCAMVTGVSLKLRPGPGAHTLRNVGSVKAPYRNSAFADRFFLKATDLALAILETHGPPTVRSAGAAAVPLIDGRQGAIYLEDFWRSSSDVWAKRLADVDVRSGDHMDLWNGNAMEIYPDRDAAVKMIGRARKVWFWECTGAK